MLVTWVTFTPAADPKGWIVKGEGTIAGLFSRDLSVGMASPTGVVPEWSREIPGEIPAVGGTEHAA
jgi:hypothetical protein